MREQANERRLKVVYILYCGHEVWYRQPWPKHNESVWCLQCNGPSHVNMRKPGVKAA